MATYNINKFSEIDFVNIDPMQDRFVMPNGEMFRFSDHMCHFCWSGGTVMETVEGNKKYQCIQCGYELEWEKFLNDFVPPTGDMLDFLLPKNWSREEKNKWFEEYKERRIEEEKIREDILTHGKE